MNIDHIPTEAIAEYDYTKYVRSARTDREQVALHAASFGVRDTKGREFGHMYTIDREVWVIDAESRTILKLPQLEDRLGETYLVEPHGLRDGRAFGAMPVASYKRFRTLPEAEAYAADVIARAEKRARKRPRRKPGSPL